MPKVAVVVCAYNASEWLASLFATVRAQTFTDWELVVGDDGSSDATAALVEEESTRDPRIRVVRCGRLAQLGAVRNRAAATSTAEYVAFLDTDDEWQPEKLARQVAVLDADPAAGYCYTFVEEFLDPPVPGRAAPLRFPRAPVPNTGALEAVIRRGNFACISSVMVRRSYFESVGGFEHASELYSVEDYALLMRAVRDTRVHAIAEPLVRYRIHPKSITQTDSKVGARVQTLFERYIERGIIPANLAGVARSAAWTRVGDELLLADRGGWRGAFVNSARCEVTNWRRWPYAVAAVLPRAGAIAFLAACKRIQGGVEGDRAMPSVY